MRTRGADPYLAGYPQNRNAPRYTDGSMNDDTTRAIAAKIALDLEALQSSAHRYIAQRSAGVNGAQALHRGFDLLKTELVPKLVEGLITYCLDVGLRDPDVIAKHLQGVLGDRLTSLGRSLAASSPTRSPGGTLRESSQFGGWASSYVNQIPARVRVALEIRRQEDKQRANNGQVPASQGQVSPREGSAGQALDRTADVGIADTIRQKAAANPQDALASVVGDTQASIARAVPASQQPRREGRQYLQDYSPELQSIALWIADRFAATALWPTQTTVWREVHRRKIHASDLVQEGGQVFDHLSNSPRAEEFARLRPWALYDTGRCRKAFDDAYKIYLGVLSELGEKDKVQRTRADVAALCVGSSVHEVHQVIWVLRGFGGSWSDTAIDSDWRADFAVGMLQHPTPTLEDVFLSRPIGALPRVATGNQWNVGVQSATLSETLQIAPGLSLSAYELVRRIGGGAMGEVWEAQHLRLKSRFAVKVMRQEIVNSPDSESRFRREAEVTSALKHPNIVNVTDFDYAGGTAYIVMEYLEGTNLEDHLISAQGNRLVLDRVLRIARQVGSALTTAHALNVVHRDLKPANVMLTTVAGQTDEWVKVVDFGIAKLLAETQTRAGVVMGTPQYMSPEQATGRDIDGRSDQFSFAAILYEMLAGRPAFRGPRDAVLHQVVNEDPPPLPDGVATSSVEQAIRRGLSKDPKRRYQSIGELVAALEPSLTRRGADRPLKAPVLPGKADTSLVPFQIAHLPARDSRVLKLALKEEVGAGGSVDLAGFQAKLDGAGRQAFDRLVQMSLLVAVQTEQPPLHRLTFVGLYCCAEDDVAAEVARWCESAVDALQESYRRDPHKKLSPDHVIGLHGITSREAAVAFCFIQDLPIFSAYRMAKGVPVDVTLRREVLDLRALRDEARNQLMIRRDAGLPAPPVIDRPHRRRRR